MLGLLPLIGCRTVRNNIPIALDSCIAMPTSKAKFRTVRRVLALEKIGKKQRGSQDYISKCGAIKVRTFLDVVTRVRIELGKVDEATLLRLQFAKSIHRIKHETDFPQFDEYRLIPNWGRYQNGGLFRIDDVDYFFETNEAGHVTAISISPGPKSGRRIFGGFGQTALPRSGREKLLGIRNGAQ